MSRLLSCRDAFPGESGELRDAEASPFGHIILGCAHEVQARRRKPLENSALFSCALLSQSITHENVSACCLRCFLSCVHYPATKRAGWLLAVMGPGWGGLIVWLCGSCGVHLSLLPMPQRLAVHLSSINHRERLLSPAVAIVSGPETVLGCAVASREEERKGEPSSKERRELYKQFSKGKVEKLKRSRGGMGGSDWKSSGRLTHRSSHYGLECFRNQNGFHF